MGNEGTAKIAFMKRELAKVIELLAAEKDRCDKIDYSTLDDDEAAEIGDDHEVVNRMLAHMRVVFSESFEE